LADEAKSLIDPHAWEGCKVRAAEKLVSVFCFPIPARFAEDIEGGFVGTHDFSGSHLTWQKYR
jgi:hypothetical protein